jgi:F-type H+-transporting ATPase subunit a
MQVVLLLGAFFMVKPVWAADEEGGNPDAIGHSADGYYLDFMPVGKLELPRLLLIRDGQGQVHFDAFGSTESALHSGRYVLTTGEGAVLTAAQVEEAVAAHTHFKFPLVPADGSILIDFSISRQLVFVFICALIVLIVGLRLAARYKKGIGRETAPHGVWQNLMEVLVTFIRDDVARPTIGPKHEKYLPYLLTVFFFIVLGNLLGLLPWGVTATSGIAVTGALAIFTFIITQFSGTKTYWKHIFWPPGIPLGIKLILIPVEVLGLFTKPVTLAVRLFANMMSGHLVIVSMLGLIFIFSSKVGTGAGIGAIFVSIPMTLFIYVLKILVSLIQAYIFTMLSALYIGMALEEHEHHDDVHHGTVVEPATAG